RSRLWDHSALDAIDALAKKYQDGGKTLHLVHLSQDCQLLLKNARDMVEVNVMEDPQYGIIASYDRVVDK
ncbi:MAG: sodium-independent anion transporter, partial [Pseudomonadota bacterium]|nr:sodium-independent anion transporter [Pseudomonadota bacterium]